MSNIKNNTHQISSCDNTGLLLNQYKLIKDLCISKRNNPLSSIITTMILARQKKFTE